MLKKNQSLEDILIEMGAITKEDIQLTNAYQKENKGVRFQEALFALNMVTEEQLLTALSKRYSTKRINLDDITINMEAARKIPKNISEKNHVIAYDLEDNTLKIATTDPSNFYGLEDIRQLTGMYLDVCIADKQSIEKAISFNYSEIDAQKAAVIANAEFGKIEDVISVDENDDTPIINLIDSLLARAYSAGASDIHIEPFEKMSKVRMRIDGTINEFVTIDKNIHPSLIARIKIMSDLDIAEKRVPQDGHFRFNMDKKKINVRVSLIPTVFGEKVVMRLLATSSSISNNSTFGMNEENFQKVNEMLKHPNGIIYITGPTGSGKSTTLYMILETIAKKKVNISTIEDPVEKNLEGINQMQVNNMSGLTFELGLRALLRQDPDVIMVGETRDNETASISVRAAITGHIVLSTLHTNDAPSSIVRLADMGVERYLISNSLTGIVAQRLVKRLCPHCSEQTETTEYEREFLGENVKYVRRARGCKNCNNTGFSGRISIHEILVVDRNIRNMVSNGATTEEIKDYAVKNGMKQLKESGIELIEQGLTTVEEVMNVAYYN